jgi:hypothetical protein
MNYLVVASGYARAFLPSMLEGVQAIEGDAGYVFPSREDAEDATGLV